VIEKKHFLSAIFVMLSLRTLSGAIFQDIDTTTPLKCIFSCIHQNRIAVDNGRIEKVIFTDDSIAVRMEDESGQIFVCSIRPTFRETVLSIVTDEGKVQDIEIRFEDRPSEVVILQEPDSETKCYTYQGIGSILNKILSGQTPIGYICLKGNIQQQCIGRGIILDTIASFEGCEETVKLIRILNKKRCSNRLFEIDFCSPETQWVYLVKDTLSPFEETIAIVSERKG
jgi:TraK protein